MKVILGIDIGGSTTKIVGLNPGGTVLSMLRVRAEDQVTSLFGALGNYMTSNHLALTDVDCIVLTGVGSSYVEGNIYGIPTHRVSEFDASGTGGLSLSGKERAVVISMGTGTAFILADANGHVRHLGGSGIGGGTLGGLCHQLIGVDRFGQIQKLAVGGDFSKVDLTIGDITRPGEDTLHAEMTAANFGKLSEEPTHADLAAGAINLVLQAIGTMSVFACSGCDCTNVVLTGSLTSLPQVQPTFQVFQRLYGLEYILPENASFATAIGAALWILRNPGCA